MELSSQQRGEAERVAARFAALLREERDPAAIWNIDVSSLLEDYMKLVASAGTQSTDSRKNVNFAEAALLIQGSASIYGRKADFLHTLVLQALSLFSSGDVGLESGGAHDDDANVDSGNQELPFLNLDDLPVLDETDEDEDQATGFDGGGKERPATSSRPPFVLLGLDEENFRDAGVSGDGEGARTCSEEAQRGLRYRSKYVCASAKLDASGAVLLPTLEEDGLPEDAEDCPPRAEPAQSVGGHKGEDIEMPRGLEEREPSASWHQSQGLHDAADDEGGWDGGGLDDDWSAPPPGEHSPSTGGRPRPWGLSEEREGAKAWGSADAGEKGMEFPDDPEEGEVYDPYKPLDMEDVTGGLPESAEHIWNRPLALGRPKLRLPLTGTLSWRNSPAFDPLLSSSTPWLETSGISAPQGTQGTSEQPPEMRFAGPTDAALDFVLGVKESRTSSGAAGRGGSDKVQGSKGRRAEFEGPRSGETPGTGGMPGECGQGEGGGIEGGVDAGFDNDEPGWNLEGDDNFGGDDDDVPTGFGGDDDFSGMGVGKEGEDAFGAGTGTGKMDFMSEAYTGAEALLQRARERDERHRTGLEKRVAQWQGALLPVLQKEEERGPFDIHQYADRVLGTLEKWAPEPEAPMAFRDLVEGGDRPEVARSFAAMLHLVNQGYISFVEEEGLGKESVEGGLTQEDSTTRGSKGASAAGSAVRVATPQSLSVSLLSSHRHDQDLVFDQLLD